MISAIRWSCAPIRRSGCPGLLGAVRAGRVVLANALGSGVLESAAWLGFLPGAARVLLGESLRLPSVATWWCGEKPALEYAIAHLDRLVVKPAFPNQKFEPRFGRDLGEEELRAADRCGCAAARTPTWRRSGCRCRRRRPGAPGPTCGWRRAR